jgi:phosphoribosylformylglycinamidine cyclo-ligase
LIGGETAELPGFYSDGEYDLAGFCVGAADKSKLITGETISNGDVILGLESSGLHSNGYSLARKVLEPLGFDTVPEGWSTPIGEAMLSPTKIYVQPVLSLLEKVRIKGIVHITGGGFYENIPRILPEKTKAVIEKTAWQKPLIFDAIQKQAKIAEREMFTTFNMGIGMVLICSPENENAAREILQSQNLPAPRIGRIEKSDGEPCVELR